MDEAGDYVTDFHLSFDAVRDLGYTPVEVAWRQPCDWDDFAIVYTAAPWDYPQHPDEFKQALAAIQRSNAVLINDYDTLLWNMDKSYLKDLQGRGVNIVPSRWFADISPSVIDAFFDDFESDKLVIKPNVGGNAADTYVLERPLPAELHELLLQRFVNREYIVQPFVDAIRDEGEFSLFFFQGGYSHAIQKVPKSGDFRVQEEHGADIRPSEPPAELKQLATDVFKNLDPVPAYGRGDWVRGLDGSFLLMELELVEPSLYLRTNRFAAARFAAALDQRFQEFASK